MTYTNSFDDVFYNGYTNTNRSLLESDAINDLNNQVADGFADANLPPCHLNFNNIGTLDFSWFNIQPTPVNFKLFSKLYRLSTTIKDINRTLINLITDLRCCGIAELYNEHVVPIFKWVLDTFIKTLINIAENIMIGHQSFKTILCVIRPVPGNPWMKSGGYDWLNNIYSYLNGFESVYEWLMDGYPIDMILNPVQEFYEKLVSCSPRHELIEYSGEVELQDDRLEQLLREYNQYKLSDAELAEKSAENAALVYAYNNVIDQRDDYLRQINSRESDIRFFIQNGVAQEIIDLAQADIVALNSDLHSVTAEIYDTTTNSLTDNTIEAYQQYFEGKSIESVVSQYEDMIAASDREAALKVKENRFTNFSIAQQSIDRLIVDHYDPACNCLTNLLGVSMYKPPKYVTVSTTEDVEVLLRGQVSWEDKTLWQEAIQEIESGKEINPLVSEIYITPANIASKYRVGNDTVDRDNSVTARIMVDSAGADDYFSSVIPYVYTNYNGAYIQDTFDVSTSTDFNNVSRLYVDSGHRTQPSAHTVDNISTIFALNQERQNEIDFVLKSKGSARQEQIQIESDLEIVWNELRRRAIAKIKYANFLSETADITAWWDNDTMIADVYEEGYAGAVDFIEGNSELARLGASFDIVRFMQSIDDTFATDLNATNPGVIIIKYGNSNKQYNILDLKTNWATLEQDIGIMNGAISRLETLIELDNVVIQIVDSGIEACSCELLCKLLQWVLDIILSTVKALVASIIDRIIKMTMNEHVAYILRYIRHMAQCAIDIAAFSDNINSIKSRADDLIAINKNGLDEMQEFAYCNDDENYRSLNETLVSVEIPFSEGDPNDFDIDDTSTYPMPAFGVNSIFDSSESGNILLNYGGTPGTTISGRNIPEIHLDCSTGAKPYLELNIEDRSTFEIMIAFRPSDYINTAIVQSVPQEQLNVAQSVTDAGGNPIEAQAAVSNISSISDIMDQVNKQILEATSAPIYLDTDCDVSLNPNNLTLCNTDNLWIETIDIIDNDQIVSDPVLYGTLGTLNYVLFGDNLQEYFPESPDADESGMVDMVEGDSYWIYSVPDPVDQVQTPTVTTSEIIVPSDTVQTPTYDVTTTSEVIEFIVHSTTIETSVTYELRDVDLYQITTVTETVTIHNVFRYPDLEFLIDFRNKVNRLKIRMLLDVINPSGGETGSPYIPGTYLGQYTNYIEYGSMNSGLGATQIISTKRLMFLAQQLLQDNYMITDARAVAETVETAIETAKDDCLLPVEQKATIQAETSKVDNIVTAVDAMQESLEALLPAAEVQQEPESPSMVIPDMKYSIPLLVLNKDENIMVQIVDRKLHLQFKANSLMSSEPFVIDHVLEVDETYMMVFNTNGFVFSMSLITPDKNILTVNGLNSLNHNLQPTLIGGNPDHTESFCGTICDIIATTNGTNTTDFYNRSLMGYIPRSSQVLFDFSVSNGSRVYNTINRAGTTFIQNEDALSPNFMSPISAAGQKADMYGTVHHNQFYQVLEGYMDNFFCKNNLAGKDFTVSSWIYDLGNTGYRHTIMSDDINQNYIYYDAVEKKLIVDFFGAATDFMFLDMLEPNGTKNEWIHITLKHILYINRFVITVHKMSGAKTDIVIDTPTQFHLMSLMAEYVETSRSYENKFNGFISTVSVFFTPIDDATYNVLHHEQSQLVRGMENVGI